MRKSKSATGAAKTADGRLRESRVGTRPRAKKRFGQHFLEPAWVTKLVAAIAPTPEDTFLEIGPGRGALTRPLAAAAGHVVAFEIDRVLAEDLGAQALPRVRIVAADFLRVTSEPSSDRNSEREHSRSR